MFLKILIISLFVLGIILVVLSTTVLKGKIGEYKVYKILVKCFNKDDIFNRLIIQNGSKTSEIDHIIASNKGIFVIETKNYQGTINGNIDDYYFVQKFTKSEYKFYSPIRQNNTHIKCLKQLIGNVSIIPVIVFVQNNKPKMDSNIVVNYKELKQVLKSYQDTLISDNELKRIKKQLINLKNNPPVTRKEHIENVNNFRNEVCPTCGGNLVIRNSVSGKFYGCSNYPTCHYTKSIK